MSMRYRRRSYGRRRMGRRSGRSLRRPRGRMRIGYRF